MVSAGKHAKDVQEPWFPVPKMIVWVFHMYVSLLDGTSGHKKLKSPLMGGP